MKKVIFFIMLLFLIVGCQPIWIIQKVETIEIGTNFSVSDIVEITEGVSVKVKDNLSILNELGESELVFIATKDGKEKEVAFKYNVIDTTKPTIILNKPITISVGNDFIVADFIDVQDNSGEFLIDKVVVSEFSSAEPGLFTALISVQDSQGNLAQMSLPYRVIVPVEKIILSKLKETLYTGKTLSLSYIIEPDNSCDKSVTWTSSNTKVAKVDNLGVVKGIAEGTAIITVQSNDGYAKSTSEINVQVLVPTTLVKPPKLGVKILPSGRYIDPSKKLVALTFDDGPHANIDHILKVLKKYDSAATFFLLGTHISRYPSVIARIEASASEIGNHAYSHKNLRYLSQSAIREEIERTDKLIIKYGGSRPMVFRPPYGQYNQKVLLAAYDKRVVNWNIDPKDWSHRTWSKTFENIKANLKDGSIIVMHDRIDSTALNIEILVKYLINQGYQLVTVSELIVARNVTSQYVSRAP